MQWNHNLTEIYLSFSRFTLSVIDTNRASKLIDYN